MLKTILLVVLAIVVIIVIAVIWLVWRVGAASARRDRMVSSLLEPVTSALAAGRVPDGADLERLAANPLTRARLYDALSDPGKTELFPKQHYSAESFAESNMVYWLAHGHELGAVPDQIELMGKGTRNEDGKSAEYFVFRFRTNPPHWAADKQWMAGVSGPFVVGEPPDTKARNTFSHLAPYEAKTLEEHIDESPRRQR